MASLVHRDLVERAEELVLEAGHRLDVFYRLHGLRHGEQAARPRHGAVDRAPVPSLELGRERAIDPGFPAERRVGKGLDQILAEEDVLVRITDDLKGELRHLGPLEVLAEEADARFGAPIGIFPGKLERAERLSVVAAARLGCLGPHGGGGEKREGDKEQDGWAKDHGKPPLGGARGAPGLELR